MDCSTINSLVTAGVIIPAFFVALFAWNYWDTAVDAKYPGAENTNRRKIESLKYFVISLGVFVIVASTAHLLLEPLTCT